MYLFFSGQFPLSFPQRFTNHSFYPDINHKPMCEFTRNHPLALSIVQEHRSMAMVPKHVQKWSLPVKAQRQSCDGLALCTVAAMGHSALSFGGDSSILIGKWSFKFRIWRSRPTCSPLPRLPLPSGHSGKGTDKDVKESQMMTMTADSELRIHAY